MIYHGKRLSGGLLVAALVGGNFPSCMFAESSTPAKIGTAAPVATQSGIPANKPAKAGRSLHYLPNRLPRRANMYYGGVWGVASMPVKTAESGELIRFSCRVLGPQKAVALIDKKAILSCPIRKPA